MVNCLEHLLYRQVAGLSPDIIVLDKLLFSLTMLKLVKGLCHNQAHMNYYEINQFHNLFSKIHYKEMYLTQNALMVYVFL